MSRAILIASVVLLAGVGSDSLGQQVADPDFDAKVARPAYTERHPRVLFDEAHFNFHTTGGRYKPFADLIAGDGLEVVPGRAKFSKESLRGSDVLVIANALGAAGMGSPGARNPAFTDAESDAVRDWVQEGGALLLITDHDPFGSAASGLAGRFGVDMSKGFTLDPEHSDPRGPSCLLFSRDNGLLGDHPIIRGRGDEERINRVLTFTGQSLKGPSGSVAFLKLADSAVDRVPPEDNPVSAAGRAQGLAFAFGKGRVVVMGEAGLLSAQVLGPNRLPMGMNFPGIDNRQLALNILHWLAPPKPGPPSGGRLTLEGLVTADPLPGGYTVSSQELKDQDRVIGHILAVLKEGAMSKAVLTFDRPSKGDEPGRDAAGPGDGPDSEKPLVAASRMQTPGGGEILIRSFFFEKAGFQIQVLGNDKAEFDKLLGWAKSVRSGFLDRGGKGSHRNFTHPRGIRVTVSGQLGDDAKPYQEREVRRAIEEAQS